MPKQVLDVFSTHCEIEAELFVEETGSYFKAEHFSARNLCSADKYKANSHLCAGENIIGPISDIEHVDKIPEDANEIINALNEAKNRGDSKFKAIFDKLIESEGDYDESIDQILAETHELGRMLK